MENMRRGQSDNRGLETVKRKKLFSGKICIIGDDMCAFFFLKYFVMVQRYEKIKGLD